jgi:hypothetical protein
MSDPEINQLIKQLKDSGDTTWDGIRHQVNTQFQTRLTYDAVRKRYRTYTERLLSQTTQEQIPVAEQVNTAPAPAPPSGHEAGQEGTTRRLHPTSRCVLFMYHIYPMLVSATTHQVATGGTMGGLRRVTRRHTARASAIPPTAQEGNHTTPTTRFLLHVTTTTHQPRP